MPPTVALLAGLALLAGCDTIREQTGPCREVPPLRQDARPKPPVSEEEQLFQPGHWEWNASSYTWREGAWIKRAGRSNLWMDGGWTRDKSPGPCRWVPAHWVR